MRGFDRIAREGRATSSKSGSHILSPRLLRLGPILAAAVLVLGLFPAAALAHSTTHFDISWSGDATAGVAKTYTITAMTAGDVTDPTYDGTADIVCSDPGAGVSCPATATGFSAGVATVSVTLVTAPTQTITATDSVDDEISDESGPITVLPAGLNKFAIDSVPGQTAGVPFSVIATAEDQFNNTITDYAGSPTITNDFSSLRGAPVDGTFGAFGTGSGTATGITDFTAESGVRVTVTDGSVVSHSNTFTVTHNTAVTVDVESAANGSGSAIGAQGVTSGNSLGPVYAIERDAYGNFVANPSVTWTMANIFEGVKTSDLSPASGANTTFTGHLVGTGTIHAHTGSLDGDSGTITVSHGAATHVRVETAADGSGSVAGPAGLVSGNTLTVFAITRDANQNFIANISGTWSLTAKSGVVDGDLTGSPGTTATLTGNAVGSANIHFVGAFTGDSGTITVSVGPAAQLRVETLANGTGTVLGSQTLTSGSTLHAYAIERDAYGNFIANVTATWTLSGPPTGGVVSGDLTPSSGTTATLTGHVTGTTKIHAHAGSLDGDSGTITVTAGTGSQIRVETAANGSGSVIATQNLTSGSSIQAYAISRDASDNFVANVSATWSLTGITGGMSTVSDLSATSGGTTILTGHLVGSAEIQAVATFTGVSGTITVVPGALQHFTVSAIGTQTAGAPFSITATAKDAAGNTITTYAGSPTITDNFGTAGGTPVIGTFPAFSSGVSTATGNIDYTAETGVHVTVNAGGVHSDSNAFNVVPGVLHHFEVGHIGNQTAGAPFFVNATAEDQWNNVITTYAGSPTITNTFSGSPVPGIFGTFVDGVGMVTQIDYTAETGVKVTVNDGTVHSDSNTFNVVPGATAQLAVAAPASKQVGVTFDVTVTAQDAFGNTTPAYTGTVAFTSSGTLGAPVPGDSTFLAGDNGVKTVSGFKFNTTGSPTVTATDTSNASINGTSAAIMITGDAPSTTTLDSAVPNPSLFGGSVVFTATVGGSVATPTGHVDFFDGVTLLGSGTIGSGNHASFTTSILPVGHHSITAQYLGDSNYFTSTSAPALDQVVNPIVPSTPAAPTGVGLSGAARISWTAPSSDGGSPITSYTVTNTTPAPAGAHGCTWTTGPLTCDVIGLTNYTAYKFTVKAHNIAGDSIVSAASGNIVPRGGATYAPLVPSRILDTAQDIQLSAPLSAGVGVTFQVTDQAVGDSTKNVPPEAIAVTGVLSVAHPTLQGYVALTPNLINGTSSTSTINFPTGDARATGVTAPLGTGGVLNLLYGATTGNTVDVSFDITGYFVDGTSQSTYFALTPNRIVDSRPTTSTHTNTGLSTFLTAGAHQTFQVTQRAIGDGTKNVPASAVAVTGVLTVTGQTAPGFLTLGPVPGDAPSTASLYFPAPVGGDNRATGLTIKLGADGAPGVGTLSVTFTSSTPGATTHVIFDVTGFFVPGTSGAMYVPVTPARIVDSRASSGVHTRTGLAGSLRAYRGVNFQVTGRGGVPPLSGAGSANVVAVTGTLTVTGQKALGFLSLTKTAINNPTTSSLNFPKGDNRATGVTVPLGSGGIQGVTYGASPSSMTTDVIFDVTGYFVQ